MKLSKRDGWNAHPKTLLRNIRPGDIFLFRLDQSRYGVGRIISRVALGHVAEFFNGELDSPNIDNIDINSMKRRGRLLILDSYSLFDRKNEGDWRIVSHSEQFHPGEVSNTYFVYGDGAAAKKVDVFDNETPASLVDLGQLPPYAPCGEEDVRKALFS